MNESAASDERADREMAAKASAELGSVVDSLCQTSTGLTPPSRNNPCQAPLPSRAAVADMIYGGRGAFEVSMKWADGELTKATIKNDHGIEVPKVLVQGKPVDPARDARFTVEIREHRMKRPHPPCPADRQDAL